METQKAHLAYLQEAIDFVNEVQLRFQHKRADYKLFLDTMKRFSGGPNLVHGMVAQIFCDHQDLLLKFEGFQSDSKLSSTLLLPETASSEDQDELNRLINKADQFLGDSRQTFHNVDRYLAFMDHIRNCWTQGLDRYQSRKKIANFIDEFPNLINECEQFWDFNLPKQQPAKKHKRSS